MKNLRLLSSIILLAGFVLLLQSCGTSKSEQDNSAAAGLTPYHKDSVIFSLSLISNINEGRFGSVDSLQEQATRGVTNLLHNDSVQQLIGTWTPVWGPVTYTEDPTGNKNPDTCVTDNTMMLLKGTDPSNPSKTLYVLAIAGTIGASSYDWFTEDFGLDTMALWPAKTPGESNTGAFKQPSTSYDSGVTNTGRYISNGLATGLNVLFNTMEDGSKGTLMNYLSTTFKNSSNSIEIAVAGHSLGGALAPCVALSLMDNQSAWNPELSCNITCYATAGFSPGNKPFATYFNQQLGANFQGSCNSNDLAIHLYETSTMLQVPTLYDSVIGNCSYLQNQSFINGFIDCFSGKIAPFGYTSIYPPSTAFTKSIAYNCDSLSNDYNGAITAYNNPTSSDFLLLLAFNQSAEKFGLNHSDSLFARTVCFGEMTLQQHVNAYVNHFGIGLLQQIYSRQLAPSISNPSSINTSMLNGAKKNSIMSSCLVL